MKIVPLPYCPPPECLLLERQLIEEIDELIAIPEHMLKPGELSTAQEILCIARMKRLQLAEKLEKS